MPAAVSHPRSGPGRFFADELGPRHSADGVSQPVVQPIRQPQPAARPADQHLPMTPGSELGDANLISRGAYPVTTSFAREAPQPSPYAPPHAPAWHAHVPGPADAGSPADVEAIANPDRAQAMNTFPFADDVFFVALDDRTGQMRAHPDVVGAALAGALLAELAAGEWIEVYRERLEPAADARRGKTVPRDALAHKVLDTILGQADFLPVEQWVSFLADTAEQEVAERLGRANQIVVEQRRRVLSTSTIYKPADKNNAAWPRARLSEQCRAHRQLDAGDVVLAGLCHASGLLHNVLDAAPAGTYDYTMQQIQSRLADHPCVLAVLGAVESIVTARASQLA
ncbi:GPP34 family phosphoprotein [Actinoplanes sp. NPDC049316]|uniref:GOLPH3/VPS74 family protein n=1 Tax=Actinoplanes sp. NPDC049316 TaxID=3154727 RepID=UPI00342F3B5E